MGSLVWYFCADGQVNVFPCHVTFVNPEKQVSVGKTTFLKFNDMNPRQSQAQNLAPVNVVDQLVLL
jgi:hypothetical protein